MQEMIKRIVIVGGGTAGWMSAAALSKILGGRIAIELVESDAIGTIGVGESTIPMIRRFNAVLDIDENDFIRETQATFKLGIEFRDWGRVGERYMHAFGRVGQDLATVDFHQYFLRMHAAGKADGLAPYSINAMAAAVGKFMRADPRHGNSPLADITHAFHLDAGLYAAYLRRYSEARGVVRSEGEVVEAVLRSGDGNVEAVRMADGRLVAGDLFLDCTGFRALLIEGALDTGFESWTRWLPCDRAWAVPCAAGPDLLPYTIATARSAGWQWRIGLQHRTGNGHVYASSFMDDDAAAAALMSSLDGEPLAEPRQLRFTAGRRRKIWNRNVVAIGLSGGFLKPLESTSIHLVQSAIARLVAFFPTAHPEQADIDEFNRQSAIESERIRDFLVLHYHATARSDSPFWEHCRTMPIPDTLQAKIELYRAGGRLSRHDMELFTEVAWLQVLHGQGVRPRGHHALADLLDEEEVAAYLGDIAEVTRNCVAVMPAHAAFIKAHCAAGDPARQANR
ncbi:tryptophan halogenase family protein [Pseudoduganella albidiflava]|uniref:Tryptophan 7-halogenase n=1 Tax=Pseudoduganella albidiflava TaxID=321983 RepID=A0A411WWN1_9BURK|nr:tryptophan halogenase family protein [Pseudoduganella albidiflava]QBI01203.1 tryptophan 7-halogenase [Pseudoduganella albidiflava]GGY48938.1 tryptophan halogenase [Pseudoduganella albidiflava]